MSLGLFQILFIVLVIVVLAAIVNLPPRARQAFELHRFEHLTYQAIAQRMGITKDSVKELMHRALVRIAEEMEAEL